MFSSNECSRNHCRWNILSWLSGHFTSKHVSPEVLFKHCQQTRSTYEQLNLEVLLYKSVFPEIRSKIGHISSNLLLQTAAARSPWNPRMELAGNAAFCWSTKSTDSCHVTIPMETAAPRRWPRASGWPLARCWKRPHSRIVWGSVGYFSWFSKTC